MGKTSVLALALTGLGSGALAHPHVFVDTDLSVLLSAKGQPEAFRVTWTYDPLFTLMLLEDLSLDPDGDGVLTEAETAALQGFDMQWPPDFPGHLYAHLGQTPLALSGPSDWTARLEGDRVISTHLRHLPPELDLGGQALRVESYDPEYYYAYRLTGAALPPGRCQARVIPHDAAAADAVLAEASEDYLNATDPEAAFPEIGWAFADQVQITCP